MPETLPRPPVGDRKMLERGRVRIEYFVSGEGDAVVLNPGFGRSVSDFNELVPDLNDAGYQTVAVQPRDVGGTRSPFLPRPTLHDFAGDLAAVVQAEQPASGRAHVLGRAFGARIARMFAGDYPDLVGAAILMAVGGPIPPDRKMLRRYALQTSGLVSAEKRRQVMEETLYAAGQRMPEHLDYRPTLRATFRQGAAVRRTRLEHWWSVGRAPVLVIHGECDRLTSPENARLLKKDFPDRVQLLMLSDAGHALMTEEPRLIERAIVSFLDEHPLAGAGQEG